MERRLQLRGCSSGEIVGRDSFLYDLVPPFFLIILE